MGMQSSRILVKLNQTASLQIVKCGTGREIATCLKSAAKQRKMRHKCLKKRSRQTAAASGDASRENMAKGENQEVKQHSVVLGTVPQLRCTAPH